MNRRGPGFALLAYLVLLLPGTAASAPAADDTVAVIGIDLYNSPVGSAEKDSVDFVLFPEGLTLLDIASVRSPDSLMQIPLPGSGGDVRVVGNYMYVARGEAGLFTFDITDPRAPFPVDTLVPAGTLGEIATGNGRLYVLDGSGLLSIGIGTPDAPVLQSRYDLSGDVVHGLAVRDTVALIGLERAGLVLLNVSHPSMTFLSDLELEGIAALGVSGNTLFVALGAEGLVTVDLADPAAPALGSDAHVTGDTVTALAPVDSLLVAATGSRRISLFKGDDLAAGSIVDVDVDGAVSRLLPIDGVVHAMISGRGITFIDVVEPEGSTFLSLYDAPNLWIQSVTASGDTLFAPAGVDGVQILSVADPRNIDSLGVVSTPEGGFAASVAVVDSFLCVAEGNSGIGVYRRTDGTEVARTGMSGSASRLIIVEQTLYATYGSAGLLTVDLSDPMAPIVTDTLAPFAEDGVFQNVSAGGGFLFSAEGAGGIGVIEISDPLHPVTVGSWQSSSFISEVEYASGTVFALLSGEGVVSIDISVPGTPVAVDTVAIDATFLRSLYISGDLAYVLDWRGPSEPGLGYLVSVTDPAALRLSGTFELEGPPSDVLFAGTIALISESEVGIEVFTTFDDFSAVPVGDFVMSWNVSAVATSEQRILTADNGGTVRSYVVFQGDSLARRASVNLGGTVTDLVTDDRRAFALLDDGRIAQLDVSNSFAIALDRWIDAGESPSGLFLADSLLYVAARGEGLMIYDVSPADSAVRVGTYLAGGEGDGDLGSAKARRVVVQDSIAYVVTRDVTNTLFLIDVSDPSHPLFLSTFGNGSKRAFDVAVYKGYAYLARRAAGISVVDVRTPETPLATADLNTSVNSIRLLAVDDILFVADRMDGVSFVSIRDVSNITEVREEDTPGNARDLALFGTYLCEVDGSSFRVYLQSFANVDDIPPTYGIGVLQSTFLNAYLDFIIVGSEVLAERPEIRFEMGDIDSLLTTLNVDVQRNTFHATYRLTSVGTGKVTVNGEDLSGNKSEASKNFSVSIARGAKGGTITASSAKLMITVPPGATSKDTYITLVPVALDELPPGDAPAVDVAGGPFRLSLGAAEGGARLAWSGFDDPPAGKEPRLHLLGSSTWTPVEGVFDAATGTLRATLPGSSTFLVSYGAATGTLPVPLAIRLDRNRPNPFNPVTTIDFHLTRRAVVRLEIYDITGRIVRRLVDGTVPAGTTSVVWDGRDRSGRPAQSGVYFSRLRVENQSRTGKLILIR